jgi:hypothetical protein
VPLQQREVVELQQASDRENLQPLLGERLLAVGKVMHRAEASVCTREDKAHLVIADRHTRRCPHRRHLQARDQGPGQIAQQVD